MNIYLNFRAQITINKKFWFFDLTDNTQVRIYAKPIKINNIEKNGIWSKKYIVLIFLFFGIYNKRNIIIYFKREVHLIKKFGAKIIIGNNILIPKGIDIIIFIKNTIITFCEVRIPIILLIHKLH